MSNSTDLCKYCQKPGLIQYHYLPLCHKVQRWCSSAEYCEKMTAHWLQKDRWMYSTECDTMYEIWDGEWFAELSWFWDPERRWLLPVRCDFCKNVVSADTINSAIDRAAAPAPPPPPEVTIICPHCFTKFQHLPQYTIGDPRNLALLGHWDGWQPFSTSNKHSCGKNVCRSRVY